MSLMISTNTQTQAFAAAASNTLAAAIRPRILVVEDEVLIALDLAHQLESAGFEVVGPAVSVDEALQLLGEEDGCDAAVLDVNLGRETAEPVARELISRSIQFVVVSGYSQAQHPPIFHQAPSLSKPVRSELLIGELRRLLQQP